MLNKLLKVVRPTGFLGSILADLPVYRRAIGGKWYLIGDDSTGWGGSRWTQSPPRSDWESQVRAESYCSTIVLPD